MARFDKKDEGFYEYKNHNNGFTKNNNSISAGRYVSNKPTRSTYNKEVSDLGSVGAARAYYNSKTINNSNSNIISDTNNEEIEDIESPVVNPDELIDQESETENDTETSNNDASGESEESNSESQAWLSKLNDLYNQIANNTFNFDLNGEELYQQYRDQYMKNAAMASKDAMGQASALSGGYGSTYAQAQASQAYQGYMSQLNSVVPTIYENAYNRFQDDQNQKLQQYSLAYDRYNDAANAEASAAQAQLDYEQQQFDNDLAEREFALKQKQYQLDAMDAENERYKVVNDPQYTGVNGEIDKSMFGTASVGTVDDPDIDGKTESTLVNEFMNLMQGTTENPGLIYTYGDMTTSNPEAAAKAVKNKISKQTDWTASQKLAIFAMVDEYYGVGE